MHKNKSQRFIWPWETRKWQEIREKITQEIHSLVEMDSRISSMHMGELRPRQITELFNTYYNDEQYAKDRVPQDVFIKNVIPVMQDLLNQAPKTFRGVDPRLLLPGISTNILLNRLQVATIISGMWFGIFNYNYISKGQYTIDDFQDPSFMNVFEGNNIFVLQCLINYFYRVYQYIKSDDDSIRDAFNAGNIILKRNALVEKPGWINMHKPISEVFIGEGHLDDSPAKIHVAFAHEIIGGELFKAGLTQEEIILLIRPECLIATVFCAKLEAADALTILGAEKMSQYQGYGSSVKFAGNYIEEATFGYNSDVSEVMLQRAIVFIDACPRVSGMAQFIYDFERDLNKAYSGFSSLKFSKPDEQIASGSWSYGFMGNNMQIKFVQQVLAASASDKCLVYYPFNRDFEDSVIVFIDWIDRNKLTIGELYDAYIQLMRESYHGPKSKLNDLDIFKCLMDD